MKKIILIFILFVSFHISFSQKEESQTDQEKKIANMEFPGHIKLSLGLNL